MKKAVLAFAALCVTLSSMATAQAETHHRVCHKVHVHHHWTTRCH